MSRSYRLRVDTAQNEARLDQFLAGSGLVSRSFARQLLAAGAVYHNRKRTKVASRKVHAGDSVEFFHLVEIPLAAPSIPFLFEDRAMVVVNKPPGMPVQGTRQTDRGTVLEAIKQQCPEAGGAARLVHRLDQETSGALVVAMSRPAAAKLSAQFAAHTAHRIYLAAVHGMNLEAQTLHHFLTRSVQQRSKGLPRVLARPAEGTARSHERKAVLHMTPLASHGGFSLLMVALETGLTHQIRAQLAASGWPIVGDRRYDAPVIPPESVCDQVALHGAGLTLLHPYSGAQVRLHAPPSADLKAWLEHHQLWLPELDADDPSNPLWKKE